MWEPTDTAGQFVERRNIHDYDIGVPEQFPMPVRNLRSAVGLSIGMYAVCFLKTLILSGT